MNCQRRSFVLYAAGASALHGTLAFAQNPAPELVKDTDANAVALGYSSDGSKTDVKKYPQYAVGQSCSVCTLYTGTSKDSSAVCPVFGGKAVSAKGWCSACLGQERLIRGSPAWRFAMLTMRRLTMCR